MACDLTVLGVLLIGFGNGCVVWAEQTLPSGLTAVLVAAVPFWMVGVERFMKASDPLTPRRLIGLGVGFGGIVLLVWPELELGNGRAFFSRRGVHAARVSGLGDRVELFAPPARRRKRPGHRRVADAFWRPDSCAPRRSSRGELAMLAYSGRSVTALVYLIVAGSLGGFSAYAYALKYLPVATVSLYAYVNPVIAVLLGTLILGEALSPRLAVAGGDRAGRNGASERQRL